MRTLQNSTKRITVTLLLSLIIFISNSQNTKFGIGALASNTTGTQNSAFGYNSLFHNTIGSWNTAVGNQSLYANTKGNLNTAVGYQALWSNKTGGNNTAIGAGSLIYNTNGSANTAVGDDALSANTTGTFNTAIGSAALTANTSAYNNTAIGDEAMYLNTTGTENTAIGASVMLSNTTGSFNTATGYSTLWHNTEGNYNVAAGHYALYYNTNGARNTAIGANALIGNLSGKLNTAVGNNTNVNASNLINSTALGNGALITASNQVRVGNLNVTSIGGYVNWSNISDGRFKKNVKDNVKGLEFIMKLKPVSYNLDITGLNSFQHKNMKASDGKTYNIPEEDVQDIKAKEQIIYNGFVAQDVEKAAKETEYVFSGVDAPKNDNDVYGLRYADFVVPLVKAVQELAMQNDQLKSENEDLKSRLDKIEQQLALKSTSSVSLGEARLEQNAPNPFNQNTVIKYYLPQNAGNAFINITDANGKVIRTVALTSKGSGQVTFQSGELAAATYQYSLFVNGKLVGTKKMVLFR